MNDDTQIEYLGQADAHGGGAYAPPEMFAVLDANGEHLYDVNLSLTQTVGTPELHAKLADHGPALIRRWREEEPERFAEADPTEPLQLRIHEHSPHLGWLRGR